MPNLSITYEALITPPPPQKERNKRDRCTRPMKKRIKGNVTNCIRLIAEYDHAIEKVIK